MTARLVQRLIFPILVGAICGSACAEQNSGKLQLPMGPGGPGRFGAYYATLKYAPDWDRMWPIADHADVVVRFDDVDHRFIFWRGTSYIPCWATPGGPWFTNEFFERRGGKSSGTTSMVEPMSDKQTRYSRVRVVESNDARVVVHWRYAPVDLDYTHAFVDPDTGWGDWVDEYYTLYPDSTGVRKATLHTSALEEWIEYQESIVINQPGQLPEDGIHSEAVELANLKGESRIYPWNEEGAADFSQVPDQACIQVVRLKSSHKPFTIVPPGDVSVTSYAGSAPGSRFNFWNHWPVAQVKSDTRVAQSAELPSHSSLTHIKWSPHSQTSTSRTWIMLHGMTEAPAGSLAPLARSWVAPPGLVVKDTTNVASEGYDPTQRAYRLRWKKTSVPARLDFSLQASDDSPIVNPAFVISGWGPQKVRVLVNGQEVQPGKDLRQGFGNDLDVENLVVWLRYRGSEPVEVSLIP